MFIDIIRGDQKVSVHLTILLYSAGARYFLITLYQMPSACSLSSHFSLLGPPALIRRCDYLPATITHVPVAAVLVSNTPDDGRLRPKHVE